MMPWHEPNWLDDFHSLKFLTEFKLRTWYHLKETIDAEIKIILQWVDIAVPQLRNIVVLSGVRQKVGRRVIWDKGKLSVHEPTEDYDIAFI
jgi:hypothetical protein